MNWYLQSSEDCDVVKSSRIRLARNLNGFKFNLENKSEIEQLENKIKDNLYSIGYGYGVQGSSLGADKSAASALLWLFRCGGRQGRFWVGSWHHAPFSKTFIRLQTFYNSYLPPCIL